MTITLKHPDSPDVIEVEPDRVALYVASGWVVVEDEHQPPAPKTTKK